jgi:hypothetical protein
VSDRNIQGKDYLNFLSNPMEKIHSQKEMNDSRLLYLVELLGGYS